LLPTRGNDRETASRDYLNKEDSENEEALTTGALSAICG
jgi:hypothetical protein